MYKICYDCTYIDSDHYYATKAHNSFCNLLLAYILDARVYISQYFLK